ncbi:MAG: response regulator [Myxococcota bacterium]
MKVPRRPRALVVDDDPHVRKSVVRLLEGAGVRVVEAGLPRDAFAAFLQAGPFDLLVLDVRMPQMTGPELADALSDPGQDQRVLFLSGELEPPRLRAGRRFLPKPFTPDELLAEVRALVGSR